MRKFLAVLPAIVFLFASCDTNPMDSNIEPRYFTITYHSAGHTSGEVPVDANRYPIPNRNLVPPEPFPIAVLLGPGTLQKDGYEFVVWALEEGSNRGLEPGLRMEVFMDMHFFAVWNRILD